MGLLDKLFGGKGGGGVSVEDGVSELAALYDDPEVKAEGIDPSVAAPLAPRPSERQASHPQSGDQN